MMKKKVISILITECDGNQSTEVSRMDMSYSRLLNLCFFLIFFIAVVHPLSSWATDHISDSYNLIKIEEHKNKAQEVQNNHHLPEEKRQHEVAHHREKARAHRDKLRIRVP